MAVDCGDQSPCSSPIGDACDRVIIAAKHDAVLKTISPGVNKRAYPPSGEGKGPAFHTRPGAPADGELGEALKLLASRRSPEPPGDLAAREQANHQESITLSPHGQSSKWLETRSLDGVFKPNT